MEVWEFLEAVATQTYLEVVVSLVASVAVASLAEGWAVPYLEACQAEEAYQAAMLVTLWVALVTEAGPRIYF